MDQGQLQRPIGSACPARKLSARLAQARQGPGLWFAPRIAPAKDACFSVMLKTGQWTYQKNTGIKPALTVISPRSHSQQEVATNSRPEGAHAAAEQGPERPPNQGKVPGKDPTRLVHLWFLPLLHFRQPIGVSDRPCLPVNGTALPKPGRQLPLRAQRLDPRLCLRSILAARVRLTTTLVRHGEDAATREPLGGSDWPLCPESLDRDASRRSMAARLRMQGVNGVDG